MLVGTPRPELRPWVDRVWPPRRSQKTEGAPADAADGVLRDVSAPAASVGAMLRPGAAAVLFGIPAAELAHCHTELDAVWGRTRAR